MEIISREAAKAQGLKLFFTGVPCPNGHKADRYVSSGACQQCTRDRCAANREHNRAMAKQHYAANKDEILEKKRQYYEANREVVKTRSQAYRDQHAPTSPRKSRTIDLTWQMFGNLTVARAATAEELRDKHGPWWICVCDCGNSVMRSSNKLRNSKAAAFNSSCGCMPPQRKTLDIAGMRFGLLVALRPDRSTVQGVIWTFKCDCGTECAKRLKDVRIGNTASCGCLKNNQRLDIKRPWRK